MEFRVDVFIKSLLELTKAVPLTLGVSVLAMSLGIVVGISAAVIRLGGHRRVQPLIDGYISFFRGTPLMIQLFIFYFGFPQVWPVIGKLSALQASVLVMGFNAGAYIAETLRGALSAVDRIQWDAGHSVGMRFDQTLRYIVLPQALRIALPSMGNTFIGVIQGTSLTFMLGLTEVMGLAKMRAAQNYRFLEVYLAAGLMYWLIVLIVGKANRKLEQVYAYADNK